MTLVAYEFGRGGRKHHAYQYESQEECQVKEYRHILLRQRASLRDSSRRVRDPAIPDRKECQHGQGII